MVYLLSVFTELDRQIVRSFIPLHGSNSFLSICVYNSCLADASWSVLGARELRELIWALNCLPVWAAVWSSEMKKTSQGAFIGCEMNCTQQVITGAEGLHEERKSMSIPRRVHIFLEMSIKQAFICLKCQILNSGIQKCVKWLNTHNHCPTKLWADTDAHSKNKDLRLLRKLWRSTVIQHPCNYKHTQQTYILKMSSHLYLEMSTIRKSSTTCRDLWDISLCLWFISEVQSFASWRTKPIQIVFYWWK